MIDAVAEHAAWQKVTGRKESCIDCHMTTSAP